MTSDISTSPRLCTLEMVAGLEASACPTDCPFWEPGGAVLAGRCAFEGVDLFRRADVARELVNVRDELRGLHEDDTREQLVHLYHRLLNTSDDS